MRNDTKHIIQRIGETDQVYLAGNTPELALERSDLRMQLVFASQLRQEQIHFLQEAIVLLEQGRVEFEEMPLTLYVKLSLNLAKAYMQYFEITHEKHFAIIVNQVLKPMAHYDFGDIYFYLAYAAAAKSEPAFTRHWLSKYSKTQDFDIELMQTHHGLAAYRNDTWFIDLIKSRAH